MTLDEIVRCHSDVVPDFTTFTLRPKRRDQINAPNISEHDKHNFGSVASHLEAAVNFRQKSRSNVMKGVTVDVVLADERTGKFNYAISCCF